ncbi:MAG: hypothetical protein KDB07_09925, partial [Planctomycetes bacterium]|nr:hypothetical protein [Planctomycetota bacterium]
LHAEGFLKYASNAGLAEKLADSKYSALPGGVNAATFRRQIAQEVGLDFASDQVTAEYKRREAAWHAEKPQFIQTARSNINGQGALKDFAAVTKTTPGTMHTRFFVSLAD